MNKRLLIIYTSVFLLIGVMLHLYRTSYNAMRVYIRDVHAISQVLVRLERTDALLHFWLNNDPKKEDDLDLYIPSDVAYDSILTSIESLKKRVLYQEQRLRLDSLKRIVKDYQRMDEKSDTRLSLPEREEYRKKIRQLTDNAFTSAQRNLEDRKAGLSDATSLLDRWLVWMLVLAGALITMATFYSFNFLHLRRKAESFNQILLETTNNGIVSFRPFLKENESTEYEVTYCNEAAMKLLRIPNWKLKTLSTIVPAGVLNDLREAFAEVIRSNLTKTLEGYLDFGKDRIWLQASVAPLEEGVLVSVYDLSPVKSYEQKLTYKIKQLELANDELQQYAYVTSHDLQEPLRKIQMFSDIALNQQPGQHKSREEYFAKVMKSASHMRELIQTLLMFTRSTDQPSEFSPVDLNVVLRKVVAELEVLIEEKKALISISDALPVIQASEVHISLLFNNLFTNSLKYSKAEATPFIKVRAETVSGADQGHFPALDPLTKYARITVSDNGVGFPPSLSDKMFTIFQRLHNKDNTPGNGIGLAICRKIVHQHHGFIYADGEEGVGATFHIFLPFEQPLNAE